MNILQRIQNLVMSVDSFDFAMLNLKGGGRVESDTEALEIGSIVSLVTDEGKELAPEGRHELQDGRTIVLDGSSKVTEIKEADAPTAAEIEAKKEDDEDEKEKEDMKRGKMNKHYGKKKSTSEMAMEMDPELISAVAEIIKKTSTELSEEDTDSLANELIKAIVAYTDMAEDDEEEKEEKEDMKKDEMKDMKVKMSELSSIVLEMAKSQQKFSTDLKKVPTGKAISEIEFSSEPEVIDPIALRIKALQNLNN